MGLGWTGAYGAAGGNAAVQAIRDELLRRALLEQQQQQQQFQNERALKDDARADARLDLQRQGLEAQREQQGYLRQRQESQDAAMNQDREVRRALDTREMLPPETFLPEDDPSVSAFGKAGLAGTLRMVPPTLPMGDDFQGPMMDGETPEQAQVGRIAGRLTMPTSSQAKAAEDDRRQREALEAQQRRDAQTSKYQDAMIANMGRGGGASSEISELRKELLQEQVNAAKAKNAPPQESPYAQERTRRIIAAIDTLLPQVSGWTAGFGGSYLRGVPGTDARDFQAELNTLKSNIAFGELAEMRQASKTGGALGAVSDRELTLLESAMGALDQDQSPDSLATQLGRIKDSLKRWSDAKTGGAVQGQSAVEYDFVPGKGLVPRSR